MGTAAATGMGGVAMYFGGNAAMDLTQSNFSVTDIGADVAGVAGAFVRSRESKRIENVSASFEQVSSKKTAQGEWHVYKSTSTDKFLAVYSKGGKAINLIGGTQYDKEVLDTAIGVITNKILETPVWNTLQPIAKGPPQSDNGFFHTMDIYSKLIAIGALDVGAGAVLEDYESALLRLHDQISVGISSILSTAELQNLDNLLSLVLYMIVAGSSFMAVNRGMNSRGKNRDASINGSIPEVGHEYMYGKKALSGAKDNVFETSSRVFSDAVRNGFEGVKSIFKKNVGKNI